MGQGSGSTDAYTQNGIRTWRRKGGLEVLRREGQGLWVQGKLRQSLRIEIRGWGQRGVCFGMVRGKASSVKEIASYPLG